MGTQKYGYTPFKFDITHYLNKNGKDTEKDIKNTVMARRNHPSIFQWSIGNEIEWTYPNIKAATGYYKGNKRIAPRRWAAAPKTPDQIKATYQSLSPTPYTIGHTAQQ